MLLNFSTPILQRSWILPSDRRYNFAAVLAVSCLDKADEPQRGLCLSPNAGITFVVGCKKPSLHRFHVQYVVTMQVNLFGQDAATAGLPPYLVEDWEISV